LLAILTVSLATTTGQIFWEEKLIYQLPDEMTFGEDGKDK
jgi:hypothetical protein